VPGSATQGSESVWYDLVDPATERAVGQVTRDGEVRDADLEVEARVHTAFRRELLVENGELAEELGVCFAGIESVTPDDASHHDLVFRNLAVLTGLVPRRRETGGA
jgi:hypothetical protein